MALLEVKELVMQFGGLRALDNVNIKIEEGSIVSLIGPNGAGKSTFFNVVTRIYEPTEGELRFNGHDLLKYEPHEIVKLGMARSFQNLELFDNMTVLNNLLVAQHTKIKPVNLPVIGGFASFFSDILYLPSTKKVEKEATQEALKVLEIKIKKFHKNNFQNFKISPKAISYPSGSITPNSFTLYGVL